MGIPGYDGWIVTLDPPEVATNRTPLSLNDAGLLIGGTSSGQGIDWGQAAINEFLAEAGQWGSTLVDFTVPNRTVTIPLGAGMTVGSDAEAAMEQLQQKVGLFQREGGWIMRQRADGQPMYADIMDATLTNPDAYAERAGVEPGISLVLECLPDLYGDEITLDIIAATGYCEAVLKLAGSQALVGGVHPARTRIVVNSADGASGVVWGFRSRYYNSAASAELVLSAAGLTLATGATIVTGGIGADAQFPTIVKFATPTGSFTNILSLQASGGSFPSHVGTYRVLAHVNAEFADSTLRLQWAAATAAIGTEFVNNDPVAVAEGDWYLADLGTVRLDPTPIGAPQWHATLQGLIGDTVLVDYVMLVPLDENSGQMGGGIAVSNVGPSEIRTEGCWFSESGVYSQVPNVLGDLPRTPPSGMEARPVELLVHLTDGDITAGGPDNTVTPFTVQVVYRPTYLFRP